jgi:hypothetical protein
MNTLDTILKSCIQTDESPKRRPSISSVSSKDSNTQSLLTTIEQKFDNIVHTFNDIPNAIEEKFEGLIQSITDIPATLEETLDDLMQTLDEYFLQNSPYSLYVGNCLSQIFGLNVLV